MYINAWSAVEHILQAAKDAASKASPDLVTWIADDEEKLSQFLASIDQGLTLQPYLCLPVACQQQLAQFCDKQKYWLGPGTALLLAQKRR